MPFAVPVCMLSSLRLLLVKFLCHYDQVFSVNATAPVKLFVSLCLRTAQRKPLLSAGAALGAVHRMGLGGLVGWLVGW